MSGPIVLIKKIPALKFKIVLCVHVDKKEAIIERNQSKLSEKL